MKQLSTEPSAQELDFHTAWMRRLARALVDDAAAAEDVVQDAWIRLGRRRGPLAAGYLAAVVRSLAWSRRRGDARRSHREAASARSEVLPSAAEVGARVEVARRVAEALESLGEPYRTTLVLRYFDDLPAAEIARRRGLPAATVRSHLKRGLEQLRERLDERSGGRATWLPALLPFARSEAAAPAALLASLATVLSMKFALLGLLAAVVVALTWHFAARDGTAGATAAALAPEARETARADASSSESSDGATGVRAAVEASSTAVDRAHDATEKPRESFPVRARAVDGADRPIERAWLGSRWLTEPSGPSGTDGRIALELELAEMERLANFAANRELELQVCAPGRRMRSLRATIAPGDGALDLGDVQLDPGAAVVGSVLDDAGLGVEGAVLVFGMPFDAPHDDTSVARIGPRDLDPAVRSGTEQPVIGRSGPGGAFRLEGVSPGHGTLWARTDRGPWTWSEPIGLRAGEEVSGVEIVVRDAPELVITGRVVDPAGTPVSGLELEFSDAEDSDRGWNTCRTDARGRFHFVPPDGRSQDLHASAFDWEWDELRRADVAAGTLDLELAFAPSRWLRVQVRAADGMPLRDGRVQGLPAEGPTDRSLPRLETTLDDEGRGRLRRTEEALRVRAEAPGYRSVVVGPFDAGSFPDPLAVTLEALPAIVGRVLRPDGAPAAGARVGLHRGASVDEATGGPRFLTHQGFSGNGEPFVYALVVEPAALATADDEGRYRLPLPGVDASVSGEVPRTRDAFAPLGYLSQPTQLAKAKRKQGWYVHASMSGEATLTSGPHSFDPSHEARLELRLPRGGSIAGRLEIEGDRSPAGWTMGASDGLAQIAETSVSAEGDYRFDDLHPGGWQLRAFEPGQRPWRGGGRVRTERVPEPDVEVEAGRTAEHGQVARPKALARLQGRLWLDGAPAGAWQVIVRGASPPGVIHSVESTLDPDGRFDVRLQPIADTSLVLVGSRADDTLTVSARVNVHAGENEWSCDLETARLEGWIPPERVGENPFDRTRYEYQRGDVRVRSDIEVDAQGHFGPITVAAGHGVLRGPQPSVREPGPIWAELDLAQGETRTLDLR